MPKKYQMDLNIFCKYWVKALENNWNLEEMTAQIQTAINDDDAYKNHLEEGGDVYEVKGSTLTSKMNYYKKKDKFGIEEEGHTVTSGNVTKSRTDAMKTVWADKIAEASKKYKK